jgi:hypothetical protein
MVDPRDGIMEVGMSGQVYVATYQLIWDDNEEGTYW